MKRIPTITLRTINDSISSGALPRLVADTALPTATKHRLKAIWKQVKQEFDNFEETRVELLKKYGEPRVLGNGTTNYEFIAPGSSDLFGAEVKDVLNVEVTLVGAQLNDSDLRRTLGTPDPLSTEDFLLLDWLIETPELVFEYDDEPVKESDEQAQTQSA